MSIEYRCSKCGELFARLDSAKNHDAKHKAQDRDLAKKKLLIKNLIIKALPEKVEGYNLEYLKKYATDIFSNLGIDLVFYHDDIRVTSLTYEVYFSSDSVYVNIKEEVPYILNDKFVEKFKSKEDSSLVFYAKKIFLDNDKSFLYDYIQAICDTVNYSGVGYRIRMSSRDKKSYSMSFSLLADSIKEIEAMRVEKKILGDIVVNNRRSALLEMEKKYCEYFKLNATCDANIISLFLESKQITKDLKDLNAKKEAISNEIKNFGRNLYQEFSSSNDIEAFAVKSGLDIETLEKYNDICNKTNEISKSIAKISDKEVRKFAYNIADNCLYDTSWLP